MAKAGKKGNKKPAAKPGGKKGCLTLDLIPQPAPVPTANQAGAGTLRGRMNVYRITTERRNQQGQPIRMLFECTVPDLETFVATLNEGKLVLGNMLWTKRGRDEDGPLFEIVDAKPLALGKGGVAGLEAITERVVRYVD